ncbi:hypothetical protein QRO08_09675 [Paracidovorax citrulli]|uniref:ATP synthase subunit I n=1 Tax=Paracidovorax citrulli TaxID=80869 RepID=A0ABY9AVH6_PARCI|nr:hypothetical protein [Paracidovorax citrulli]WIY40460.1 hypothetical protein QRO10_05825 [Paracidovorax citrulli]WIY42304.1 hypothetical protein QRO12_15195 [Paracidovorax citrulli]WIY50807.1 hypothetical protein QRO08_09675 [Paracidovorax citrulli]
MREFDRWLLAQHQHVVDWVQRSPGWLSEQCALMMAVLTLVGAALEQDWGAVGLALVGLSLGCIVVLFLVAREPVVLAAMGARSGLRWGLLALLLVRLTLLVLLLASGLEVRRYMLFSVVSGVGLVAYVYFAACRPPRPRLPRQRIAAASGAAR